MYVSFKPKWRRRFKHYFSGCVIYCSSGRAKYTLLRQCTYFISGKISIFIEKKNLKTLAWIVEQVHFLFNLGNQFSDNFWYAQCDADAITMQSYNTAHDIFEENSHSSRWDVRPRLWLHRQTVSAATPGLCLAGHTAVCHQRRWPLHGIGHPRLPLRRRGPVRPHWQTSHAACRVCP